jgi:hypothetical protein
MTPTEKCCGTCRHADVRSSITVHCLSPVPDSVNARTPRYTMAVEDGVTCLLWSPKDSR